MKNVLLQINLNTQKVKLKILSNKIKFNHQIIIILLLQRQHYTGNVWLYESFVSRSIVTDRISIIDNIQRKKNCTICIHLIQYAKVNHQNMKNIIKATTRQRKTVSCTNGQQVQQLFHCQPFNSLENKITWSKTGVTIYAVIICECYYYLYYCQKCFLF